MRVDASGDNHEAIFILGVIVMAGDFPGSGSHQAAGGRRNCC
jgi:hypothetical protein